MDECGPVDAVDEASEEYVDRFSWGIVKSSVVSTPMIDAGGDNLSDSFKQLDIVASLERSA